MLAIAMITKDAKATAMVPRVAKAIAKILHAAKSECDDSAKFDSAVMIP